MLHKHIVGGQGGKGDRAQDSSMCDHSALSRAWSATDADHEPSEEREIKQSSSKGVRITIHSLSCCSTCKECYCCTCM
jgi:hypothetical protein